MQPGAVQPGSLQPVSDAQSGSSAPQPQLQPSAPPSRSNVHIQCAWHDIVSPDSP
jgi:hypothetical protein